eukprot:CCRYP_011730-RA/>CCRYP_011730-RA protein AED:0.48 eAED:0.48 QI:0/-1/0/1/-1/1/1/0/125
MEAKFKLNFKPSVIHIWYQAKPTSIKNPQANTILERMHQVIMTMLCTAELDMANTVAPSAIADFLTDAAWAARSTYHMVPKPSRCSNIWQDMLFDIPFLADWNKIGDHRQHQTMQHQRENKSRFD